MTVPVPAVLPDSRLAPAQVRAKFNTATLAGLGATVCEMVSDGSQYCYDDGTGDYQGTIPAGGSTVVNVGAGTPGTFSTGANTSAAWASVVNSLVKSGMTLAQIQAAHPGMSISPNGQIIYQNPGYPVGTGGISVGGGLFGSSSSMLLIGGAALLMIVALGGRR
jgi:hypothetical protein